MDEKRVKEIAEQIQNANAVLYALCSGERKWTMSVPARLDYDPDLIIGAALHGAGELLADREALMKQNLEYDQECANRQVRIYRLEARVVQLEGLLHRAEWALDHADCYLQHRNAPVCDVLCEIRALSPQAPQEVDPPEQPDEPRYVTREMALDAGDPSLEGQRL